MNPQPGRANTSLAATPLWKIAAATVWIIAFAVCFYRFDLPNSGDPKINRLDVWEQTPSLLLNMVDPPRPNAVDIEARELWKNAGWRFWPQRFGMYGVSLFILSGAWGWGSLGLRFIRMPLHPQSLESTFFSMTVGLSAISLLTLACGLAGALSRSLLGSLLFAGLAFEIGAIWLMKRPSLPAASVPADGGWSFRGLWPLWLFVPFLMIYIGGAFLPEVDFDVKEYHFGGPKEWYQAGKISFLPHNVYTSFPFLTEMLTLLGMVLYGDWYWGAIAGKGVLMCFAPFTALGLFIAGRRWFSPAAGFWAAGIHLSTPWIYRISIIAYAEGGLACFLFATLLAVLFYLDSDVSEAHATQSAAKQDRLPWLILAGFLAGSSMACKYPGAVSVVIPLGLALMVKAFQTNREAGDRPRQLREVVWIGVVFSGGVALAIGPWLLKNLAETGNPVYPLLYGIFGGADWNAELDAKWKHGHSPDHHQLIDLAVKLMDVTLKSDWLSPLLFGLAPLAWLVQPRRRLVRGLWIYVAYLFGTWWLLTHRIDRFWVPLIPVVSLLAGVGATWSTDRLWRISVNSFAICAVTFNFAFMTTSLCGYNAYLLDLTRAAEQTARITAPEVVILNSALPPESKVLCVGEAELFDARFPYIYNTVFDKSIFEELVGTPDSVGGSGQRPLKSTAEIRQSLRAEGITHVFVNWQEILRYRLTYGYTDFVTPHRFQQLQSAGILDPAWPTPANQLFDRMNSREQHEVRRWGPELIRTDSGQTLFQTFEVFPVLP